MILLSVLRTKIIECCINYFFSKLQNNLSIDKILTPGKKIRKIRNSHNVEHYNCIIEEIYESKFSGETLNIVTYYEQKDPTTIYNSLQKHLEIFY